MYQYIISSKNIYNAIFIRDLLEIHGMKYNWECVSDNTLSCRDISISVKSNHKDEKDFTMYLLTDSSHLNQMGIEAKKLVMRNVWARLTIGKLEVPPEIPIWPSCFLNISKFAAYDSICSLSYQNKSYTIGIMRSNKSISIILALDIIRFIEYSLLGTPEHNHCVDWCEINGYLKEHKHSDNSFIDDIIITIRKLLQQFNPNAFPIYIDYFPVNHSAPVMITGDSDECSISDTMDYLSLFGQYQIVPCLLLKSPFFISEHLPQIEKFKLGVHPYAQSRLKGEYMSDFHQLKTTLQDKNHCLLIARNHLFQNIDARWQIAFERKNHVIFDLNSVLANNNTWIGTGNGVGIPIPFPPLFNNYNKFPLSLPTVIEDDVFLFSYDYCYKPTNSIKYSAEDLILIFLENWVKRKNKPAQVNFHPQNPSYLLKFVIDWIYNNNIWCPNPNEYLQWMVERDNVIIQATRNGHYSIKNCSSRINTIRFIGQ